MKLVVTGSSGQLAHAIQSVRYGHEVIAPSETELDILSPDSIHRILTETHPDVMINTAAFTQVDRCEAEPMRAMAVNGEAVARLAEACNRHHVILVQISTDYVFDGLLHRPYREDDAPRPLNVYGQSKLAGERNAQMATEHLVLRTAWLYGSFGQNFYTTMLKLAREGQPVRVVNDQTGTPTSCRALARQISVALEMGWRGLFHASCSGETTWYGFAQEIFKLHALSVDLSPCKTPESGRAAVRPPYSVLDVQKRKQWGDDVMPGWREALIEVVREM